MLGTLDLPSTHTHSALSLEGGRYLTHHPSPLLPAGFGQWEALVGNERMGGMEVGVSGD